MRMNITENTSTSWAAGVLNRPEMWNKNKAVSSSDNTVKPCNTYSNAQNQYTAPENTITHCGHLDGGVIRSMFPFLSALVPTAPSSWMEFKTEHDPQGQSCRMGYKNC